jgi:hypothetical protein
MEAVCVYCQVQGMPAATALDGKVNEDPGLLCLLRDLRF